MYKAQLTAPDDCLAECWDIAGYKNTNILCWQVSARILYPRNVIENGIEVNLLLDDSSARKYLI